MPHPMDTTWDGLPISREPPYGASVVVFRRVAGALELLMLHRAHHGPEYEGDWAWTPPSGARLPGEPIEVCARRELLEESGLDLEIEPTACGTAEWHVFVAEAPAVAQVVLDGEHDRHVWVTCDDAVGRCRPDLASVPLQAAVTLLGVRGQEASERCPSSG